MIRISPVHKPVTGSLSIPGSKSIGNRAILLAAVAQGESVLKGVLDSDDTQAALSALSALGIAHHQQNNDIAVSGNGLAFPNMHADINIRSSGTVGRFLPGLLASCTQGEWRLVSTPQLAARPIKPLVEALEKWGAGIAQTKKEQSFPLIVKGLGLPGGIVNISAAASSQFASGLLMAAPLCQSPALVVIHDLDPEEAYIDMTLDLLRMFGVEPNVTRDAAAVTVSFDSPRPYHSVHMTIEADANTACYFFALAVLTGGTVTVDNLRPSSDQPGLKFLDILERLGGTITRATSSVTVTGTAPAPDRPLRGGFSIDMRAMSEMALTLGVMAVFADKPVTMTNLSHIRGHETDRIAALASLLHKVGVQTEERPDGVVIHPLPTKDIDNVIIDPQDDHRIAMSFSLLGAAANGIGITSPHCVNKTCPPFFTLLEALGIQTSLSE